MSSQDYAELFSRSRNDINMAEQTPTKKNRTSSTTSNTNSSSMLQIPVSSSSSSSAQPESIETSSSRVPTKSEQISLIKESKEIKTLMNNAANDMVNLFKRSHQHKLRYDRYYKFMKAETVPKECELKKVTPSMTTKEIELINKSNKELLKIKLVSEQDQYLNLVQKITEIESTNIEKIVTFIKESFNHFYKDISKSSELKDYIKTNIHLLYDKKCISFLSSYNFIEKKKQEKRQILEEKKEQIMDKEENTKQFIERAVNKAVEKKVQQVLKSKNLQSSTKKKKKKEDQKSPFKKKSNNQTKKKNNTNKRRTSSKKKVQFQERKETEKGSQKKSHWKRK